MSKLNRILWAGLVLGVAACGDDVTVTQPPEPTPGIRSVSVAPNGVTIQVGGTVTMTAAVVTDPGATGTPTIAWSSSAPAIASVGASSGVVTGVAAGSAGITATATLGTSVGSGNATVTVVPAAACTINSVTVSPTTAALVVGQTLPLAANVQGTNCAAGDLGVTYSGGTAGVATINATSGVITAVGAGSTTFTATSTKDATKAAVMSVTVGVPAPATVAIQSVTQFATNLPVDLSNVGGQVEVTLNVDPGAAPAVTKAQVLIGGTVVAEQIFGSASAAMGGSPALATQTLVLSTNTRQVRKPGSSYVPVIFNGPSAITARIYVTGSSTPAVSNAVPVVMQNKDAVVQGNLSTSPATLSPSFTNSSGVWYTGDISYTGGSYIAFFPVIPVSISLGSTACTDGGSAPSGTVTGGLAFSGTLDCSGVEQANVALDGTVTVVPGAAPEADVIYLGNNGIEVVGTMYNVDGDSRWNLLSGSFTAPAAIDIDNVGPTITPNEIGYLAGCSPTIPTPGCWVGTSYDLNADFPATDAGSGAGTAGAAATTWAYADKDVVVDVCGANSFSIASAAENSSPTNYDICATVTDPLGNASSTWGFNAFGVDKTAPTMAYAIEAAKAPLTLFTDSLSENVLPNEVLDYQVNDNNSGLDDLLAMKVTLTNTLNGTCAAPVISTALSAEVTPGADRYLLTGQAPDAGCALPGYYYWSARVEDRAGNTVTPITHNFGFEPGAPTIVGVNVNPLYGGTLNASVDVFATHTGASLQGAKMGIWYTTAGTATVGFVYNLGEVFNADWATPLYLATPAAGAHLTVAGSLTLSGVVTDSTQAPVSAFDSLSTIVTDVFTPYVGTLVHADTANTVIALPFIDATKVSTDALVWANPNIGAATFSVSGTCTFTYATPTNGPTIPSSVWVVDATSAPMYDVLFPITAAPTLLSDNGTTRLYRYSVASGTCASLGSALQLVAVKADAAGLPVGYLVP